MTFTQEQLKELALEAGRLVLFGAAAGIYAAVKGELEASDVVYGTIALKVLDHYAHRIFRALGYPGGIKGLSAF